MEVEEYSSLIEKRSQYYNHPVYGHFFWTQDIWSRTDKLLDLINEYPFLEEIYKDSSKEIVIMKGSQMGISEWLASRAIWFADQLGLTVLYTFPAFPQISDFVNKRIDGNIEASEYLSARTRSLEENGTKLKNRVSFKQVGEGYVYFRGATTENQLISVDADVVIMDERDRFKAFAVSMLPKRLGNSKVGRMYKVSTPVMPEMGIHADFMKSTQKYYYVKCEECGKMQKLTYQKNVDRINRRLVCSGCNSTLKWSEGEWIAENPTAKVQGYHISRLYSPRFDVGALIDDMESNDPEKVREAYNQELGIPYAPPGSKLTADDVRRMKREVEPDELNRCIELFGCYLGVDVGKQLHMTLSTTVDNKPFIVAKRTLKGWGEKGASGKDYLSWWMDNFPIIFGVIDGAPEIHAPKNFMKLYPFRLAINFYTETGKSVKSSKRASTEEEEREIKGYVIHSDRTLTFDRVFENILSGYLGVNSEDDYDNALWEEQLCNIQRATAKKNGVDVAVYVNSETKNDDYIHSLNYNTIARYIVSTYGLGRSVVKYREREPTKKNSLAGNLLSKDF